MSTTVDARLLRTIHRVLRQQTDLNGRIARGPAKVKVAKNAESAFQTSLQEASVLLKDARMSADRKQLQLQDREARIEGLETKRNACESNREYQVFNDQIQADEQANSVQSDEIFEILEKIDDLESTVKTAESNLEKGKTETEKVIKTVQLQLDNLQNDLNIVHSELADAESRLPMDIRQEYQRLVAALGEEALASVEDNSCGHCYTNVTTQLISELMMKRVTFCKSCGSLLYLSENATV